MKKLSLSALSKKEFDKRELGQILGGENCCLCNCNINGSSVSIGNYAYSNNDDSGMGYGAGAFNKT